MISDTISQNRIVSRIPQIELFPHTIVKTVTTKVPAPRTNKILLGIGVGRSVEQFGLSANIGLMTKKDNLYTLSYDALNKDIYLTMYWKLSFRKK